MTVGSLLESNLLLLSGVNDEWNKATPLKFATPEMSIIDLVEAEKDMRDREIYKDKVHINSSKAIKALRKGKSKGLESNIVKGFVIEGCPEVHMKADQAPLIVDWPWNQVLIRNMNPKNYTTLDYTPSKERRILNFTKKDVKDEIN